MNISTVGSGKTKMKKINSLLATAFAASVIAVLVAPKNADAGMMLDGSITLQATTPGTVETGHMNISGNARAAAFFGSGASLTNLSAGNLTSGFLPNARLSPQVGRTDIAKTYTAAQTFSSLSNSFTGSGAGLTGLNATNITTGTLNLNRLPATVARTNANNVFTGTAQFPQIGLGAAPAAGFALNSVGALRTQSFVDFRNSTNTTTIAQMGRDANNNGIATFAGNNVRTVEILGRVGTNPGGSVGLFNTSGQLRASFGIDNAGGSVLACNVKNFVTDNPDDANTHIYYAAIEGPEVASYTRGKATLVNGEAVIDLPSHFTAITNEDTVTVQLTPRSASSKGLAAVEVSGGRIFVRELGNGQGSYSFDWRVEGVRSGYENYRVVRPKHELETGIITTGPRGNNVPPQR